MLIDYKYIIIIIIYIFLISGIIVLGIISKIIYIVISGIILLILIILFNLLPLIISCRINKELEDYIKKYNYVVDNNQNKDMCAICLNDIESNSKLFCYKDCGHIFDLDCIKKWIPYNKNCPLCRKNYP